MRALNGRLTAAFRSGVTVGIGREPGVGESSFIEDGFSLENINRLTFEAGSVVFSMGACGWPLVARSVDGMPSALNWNLLAGGTFLSSDGVFR